MNYNTRDLKNSLEKKYFLAKMISFIRIAMHFHDGFYPQSLQQSLNELRCSGELCDVVLEVENQELKAHKSVLSAASSYFKAMFSTEASFKESKQEKIHLHDIDHEALAAIIDFIYTSVIEITEENVYLLMEAANLLQISALRASISHYLISTITLDNCLSLYVIASLHQYRDLAKEAFKYLLINFETIISQTDFLQLPLDILSEILSSRLLNIADEGALLKSVMKWVNADIPSRKDHLEELLGKIELSQVPIQTLIQVKNDPVLKSSLQCKIESVIMDTLAKKYESGVEDFILINKSGPGDSGKFRYGSEQGVIFAIGGETSGMASRSIECFTLGYDAWKFAVPRCILSGSSIVIKQTMVIPAMRCARYNSAVSYDSYNVYVIGGRNSTSLLDECEAYDVRLNQWRNLCRLPLKLEGGGGALLEGRLICIGGHITLGATSDVWEWDERRYIWKSLPPLITPRCFHGTVSAGGYIFALGGYSSGSSFEKEPASRTCERFDPGLNKWFRMPSMHEARARFGCAVVDDYIYVMGGIDGNKELTSVERYNIHTNEWSYMCPMPVPRNSFSVAVSDKRIYCMGGSNAVHFLNTVEKFNPRTNRWHCVHAMQVSRFGVVAATLFVPLIKGIRH